jgi:arsenate reductase-like glutaredoxin family protein
MKKMLFTLTVLVAAAAAMTFTSCKKNETAGEKLDNAIEKTGDGVNKFTKKAEDAAKDTNEAVSKAIDDIQK